MDLQEFKFVIKHQSGKSNSKADIGPDNEGVILLKEEMFTRIFGLKETHDTVYDDVGKLTHDKWDSQVTEAIKQRDPDWVYKDGYITWKGRIYIPNNE